MESGDRPASVVILMGLALDGVVSTVALVEETTVSDHVGTEEGEPHLDEPGSSWRARPAARPMRGAGDELGQGESTQRRRGWGREGEGGRSSGSRLRRGPCGGGRRERTPDASSTVKKKKIYHFNCFTRNSMIIHT